MDPTTSWFSLLTGSYNKDCGMCYPVCGILQITFLLPALYTTVVVTMVGGVMLKIIMPKIELKRRRSEIAVAGSNV